MHRKKKTALPLNLIGTDFTPVSTEHSSSVTLMRRRRVGPMTTRLGKMKIIMHAEVLLALPRKDLACYMHNTIAYMTL